MKYLFKKKQNNCDHICSGFCRYNGCNCECGEWHEENDNYEAEVEIKRMKLLGIIFIVIALMLIIKIGVVAHQYKNQIPCEVPDPQFSGFEPSDYGC